MALTLPWTFASQVATIPTNRLDANNTTIAGWINTRNPTVGLFAARPAPGNAGSIYVASDQANAVYVDDGTAWQSITVSAGGANFVEFIGIATPTSPSAGAIRFYSPSAPAGVRRLRWIDAGGQLGDVSSVLIRGNGNPLKDVNTTVTETSIFGSTQTIKGGTLGTDRRLRITLFGDILNNTGGTQGATLRIKYGGTTFLTYGPGTFQLGTIATRYGWTAQGDILASGATNVQVARGRFSVPIAGSSGIGGVAVTEGISGASIATWMAVHTGGSVDSTVDQTFDITFQPTVNSAALSIRVFAVIVEVA